MKKFLKVSFTILALSMAMTVSSTVLASDHNSETRNVDAKVSKVLLDGVIELKLKQGATASLTVYGDKQWLPKVTTVQTGDTLRIDTDSTTIHGLHGNKLRAELTLPALQELHSNGVGTSEVSGFSGEILYLTLSGAGAINLNAQYKHLDARLAGVGSMNLTTGSSDDIDLNLPGVGNINLNGQSKLLKVNLSGLGSINAQQLMADHVTLNLSGLGSAIVSAKQIADINLSGLGSATIYGNPPKQNANASGLGRIIWK
jgi:hypothetical protein